MDEPRPTRVDALGGIERLLQSEQSGRALGTPRWRALVGLLEDEVLVAEREGPFAEVVEHFPECAAQAKTLQSKRRSLLAALRVLMRQATSPPTSDFERARLRAMERIRQQQAAERRLLQEPLLRDLGGES